MGNVVYCVILLLALFWHPVQSQHVFNIAFDNHYSYDEGRSIVQTQDGGFISFGNTGDPFTFNDSILIVKFSADGQLKWKFTLDVEPGTGTDFGRSLLELADGSLVGCGYAPNASATHMKPFLLKVTAQGQLVWLRRYGSGAIDQFVEQVKQTPDGGFVLAGSFGGSAWLIKTDSLGFLEWDEQYSPVPSIGIYSIDLTQDGGYVLGGEGFPSSPAGLNRQMLVVKTDSLGNQQWFQHFGGNGSDRSDGVIATFDGGYFIGGRLNQSDGYVIKTDSAGNEEWHYQSSGTINNTLQWPIQLPDSTFIIAGSYNTQATEWDGRLTKLTSQGVLIWERTYRYNLGATGEYFYGITSCTDGGFAITGMVVNNALPQKNDMWILKTDACGNTVGDTLNPQAGMSLSNGVGVNADSYSFTNQSTGHCWQIWYFGDGDSTLVANPQHTYQPGTYTVTLVVFAGAYSDTVTQQITVLPCGSIPGDTLLPNAAMLVSPGTQNGIYSLQTQSSEYCSLLWYFGDGETSTATNPHHQYPQNGTYTITHFAIKGIHADTVTQEVTVNYACNMAPADTLQPEAAMLISPSTQTGTYSFTSQSTEYCSLLWYFGDGDSSDAANPQHAYQQSGNYSVMHIAIAGAEADTVTELISVLVGVDNDFVNTTRLEAYPNPTSNAFTINYYFPLCSEEATLHVFNMQGVLVEKQLLKGSSGNLELNAAGLPAGLYLLQANCKGRKVASYKLTLQ